MVLYKYMYTLTSYCKVHALLINVLYTGHISVHMHISYVLRYVLRGGAGGGTVCIGLERIVSVCNIHVIGHQEVVLWAPTFPTHLDPPSSFHQLVEGWGWGRHSSWFLGADGAAHPCHACHVVLSTHLVPPALHWAVFFCIILLSSQPYMSSSSTYSSPPAHKASG